MLTIVGCLLVFAACGADFSGVATEENGAADQASSGLEWLHRGTPDSGMTGTGDDSRSDTGSGDTSSGGGTDSGDTDGGDTGGGNTSSGDTGGGGNASGAPDTAPYWIAGLPAQFVLNQGTNLQVSSYSTDDQGDARSHTLKSGNLGDGLTFSGGNFNASAGAAAGARGPFVVTVLANGLSSDSPPFMVEITSPGSTPVYVPTTAFHTRALAGSFAPASGPVSWKTASPAWNANAIVHLNTAQDHVRKITAYSGGFSDPARRHLYAHGGGHGDSAYNGILRFDLNGTSQPAGWSVVPGSESKPSDVPITETDHVTYFDGKAGSTHTYDSMLFDSISNRMYRINGSYWLKGTAPQNSDWRFDFGQGQWGRLADRGFHWSHRVDVAQIHSPNHRKAVFLRAGVGRIFDVASETWSSPVSVPNLGYHYHGAYDPTRNRGFVLGAGSTGAAKYHAIIDWASQSIGSWQSFTSTGDDEILDTQAFGVFYDEALDRLWLFGGRNTPFNKIYWINAGDFDDNNVTVFSAPLLGDGPVASSETFQGLYKRFLFVNEWRALAVVTTGSDPVYLIRLP